MKTSKTYDYAMIFLTAAFIFTSMIVVVTIFTILPALATIAGIIIVGMAIISIILLPSGLLGILWDEQHKTHTPPTKINHHPIHWQDPK